MTIDDAMNCGNAQHEGGAWRIANYRFEYLGDDGDWFGFILLSLTNIPCEGWLEWNGLIEPCPWKPWMKKIKRLNPDAVCFRDGVFTAHGMRIAAEYCRALQQGKRRIDIEDRYEDAFSGALHDFRHSAELCAEQAEYEEQHGMGAVVALF